MDLHRRSARGVLALPALVLLAACASSANAGRPGPTATTRAAVATTSHTVKLPIVGTAETAACQAEAATIKIAEDAYSTLNGEFANLETLRSDGFLRDRPAYWASIRMGTPTGGYTLVGVEGKCGLWPIVD
jgi:hypothetical protein